MKKINLCLLLIASLIICDAQKITVKESANPLIGSDLIYKDGCLYGIHVVPALSTNVSLTIYKYDKDLNILDKVDDDVTYNGQRTTLGRRFLKTNNYLYIDVNGSSDPIKMQSIFTLARLGKNNKLITFPFELGRQEINVKKVYFGGIGFNPSTNVSGTKVSPDGKVVAALHDKTYIKEKGNEIFHVKVFDEDLKTFWEKDIELPDDERKAELTHFEVANNGNLAVLATVNSKTTKGKDTKLLKLFLARQNEFKDIEIPTGKNLLVTSIRMSINEHDELILAGSYTNENDKDLKAVGIFAATYDWATGKNINFKCSALTDEEISLVKHSDWSKTLQITDLKFFDDGSPLLIFQMRTTGEIYFTGASTTTTEYFGEKLVIGLDKNCNVSFNQMIDARYSAAFDGRDCSFSVGGS